jgi:hypothetical protein
MNEPTEHGKSRLVLADEPFIDPRVVSAAKMTPRLPQMLRKAGRTAGVYALSYMAVKTLDKAAEMNPTNKFVRGADEIANVVFGFENLMVDGTLMVAEAGYDAITKPKPEITKTKPEAPKIEPPVSKNKHHRNRANLNAALAPDDLPATNHSQPTLVPAPMPKGRNLEP